jgi:hypothetical protein
MSWYRRFKNRKYREYYEITGKQIEDMVQEYFDENELNYSRRWMDYKFDNTVFRVMRRTSYEFALDEIHTLFSTLSPLPEYHIDLDYIRQELKWFREFVLDSDLIYTMDWLLHPTTRPTYFFMKYYHIFMKHVQTSNLFREGEIVSCFPCDPEFGDVYYNDEDITKVVVGSEKRGKIWASVGGMSRHRIFGHQWARVVNHQFEPMIHPRFKCRTKENGRYDT